MSFLTEQQKKINSLIIPDYNMLCRYIIGFNSEKVKSQLLKDNSVLLEFSDLNFEKEIEVAKAINNIEDYEFVFDLSEIPFCEDIVWSDTIQEGDTPEKRDFIEQVESWSFEISLPDYIEDVFLPNDFELRFEGRLVFFIQDVLNNDKLNFSMKREAVNTTLKRLVNAIYSHQKHQKEKKHPKHILETFSILKTEYEKAYQSIYKDFGNVISEFYNFDNAILFKNSKTETANHFTLNKGFDPNFKKLRKSLVDKKFISDKTNYLTLENAFKGTGTTSTKIDWTGGKDRLGSFVKLLKDKEIVKDLNHYKIALNIFSIDEKPIPKLRNPKKEDFERYRAELEKIINKHFPPPQIKVWH